jgi:hypothetical protein
MEGEVDLEPVGTPLYFEPSNYTNTIVDLQIGLNKLINFLAHFGGLNGLVTKFQLDIIP